MVIRKTNGRTVRAGFTLVELLVVITIITILAGLITVAAFNAVKAARDFAINSEVQQIAAAINVYKNENGGFFPSDTTTATGQALLRKHMRRLAKNHRDTAALGSVQLDPSEALVFFLGGNARFYDQNDPAGSVTPAQPQFCFLLENSENPLTGTANGQGKPKVYYEFDETRLVDPDGDGLYSYAPDYSEGAPLVYFNGVQYAQYDTAPFAAGTFGNVKPYKKPSVKTAGTFEFIDRESFQIIAAGQDGNFGEFADPTNYKVFPDGNNFTIEDNDNISNFSKSGRFENSAL